MEAEEAVVSRSTPAGGASPATITSAGLDQLITLLATDGYTVVGPTVREEELVLDEIDSTADLPVGWTDHQAPGAFRLRRSEHRRLFDCLTGAQSWKQFLFPARRRLWTATRAEGEASVEFATDGQPDPRYAFLGVRSCDLAAILIQDRVFTGGNYKDPVYTRRRDTAFIIAVNCTRAGSTCFCASMGTGPQAGTGFDLVLTEMSDRKIPVYLVQSGTDGGAELLARLDSKPADDRTLAAADALCQQAATDQARTLEPETARQALLDNLNHARWQTTAQRCLACGNCTMVCPTCFCATVEDTTNLPGTVADRRQVWDTCFHLDHSYIHGGSVRRSTAARYRQWITHKLATWQEQYGTAGCVGCGRCITWCPVGIDITEEVEAISPVAATVGRGGNK